MAQTKNRLRWEIAPQNRPRRSSWRKQSPWSPGVFSRETPSDMTKNMRVLPWFYRWFNPPKLEQLGMDGELGAKNPAACIPASQSSCPTLHLRWSSTPNKSDVGFWRSILSWINKATRKTVCSILGPSHPPVIEHSYGRVIDDLAVFNMMIFRNVKLPKGSHGFLHYLGYLGIAG